MEYTSSTEGVRTGEYQTAEGGISVFLNTREKGYGAQGFDGQAAPVDVDPIRASPEPDNQSRIKKDRYASLPGPRLDCPDGTTSVKEWRRCIWEMARTVHAEQPLVGDRKEQEEALYEWYKKYKWPGTFTELLTEFANSIEIVNDDRGVLMDKLHRAAMEQKPEERFYDYADCPGLFEMARLVSWIARIDRNKGKTFPLPQEEIARVLRIKQPTVSKYIRRLSWDGVIRKATAANHDARLAATYVYLEDPSRESGD